MPFFGGAVCLQGTEQQRQTVYLGGISFREVG